MLDEIRDVFETSLSNTSNVEETLYIMRMHILANSERMHSWIRKADFPAEAVE